MTKKIIAGVLALTLVMGSAALPSGVFENVAEKTSITASAYEEKDEITSGDYKYGILDDGTVEIAKYTGSATTVTIPSTIDGKKVTSIGYCAFAGKYNQETDKYESSLVSITIPSSVTSIGNNAFVYCTSLSSITIPNSVTSIGDYAFSDCTSLANITIPNSVTSIGKFALYYCTKLASITIPNSITSIEKGVLGGCSSLANITIPNSVTSIGEYAFYRCTGIASITIPNSVASIGDHALNGCTSLTSINVDSSNSEYSSWNGILCDKDKTNILCCPAGTKLTSITIPNSVTSIEFSAFCNCTSLTSITIPNSVTNIGDCVFEGCTSLASITIPSSVIDIGGYIFEDCTSLTSINVDSDNFEYSSWNGILCNKDKTDIICCPEGTKLTSITIPNSVTSIEWYAFCGCTSLANITIPNSVTDIGNETFSKCTSLKSITIPNSVTSIEDSAFGYNYNYGDDHYEKISNFKIYCYSSSAGEKYAKDNGFSYELLDAPVVTTTTTKRVTTTAKPTTTTKKVTTTTKPTTTTKSVTTTAMPTTTTKKITTAAKKNVKNASVPKIPDKAYNGKAICPAVKVKYGKTVLKNNTDYTVSYKYNKSIGKASVVIKGKGKYTGTKTVTFKINPKKQTAKLTSYNDAFKASWTKDKQATGYQVMYAKSKTFNGSKTYTVNAKTLSKKIKGKNKTTYYVKVRTYKTVSGTKYYGAWSTAKAVKTK